MRHLIAITLAVALSLSAAPALAANQHHSCTVLAGTQAESGEGPVGPSATTPVGGVGECHLHTLEVSAKLVDKQTPDGCEIHVDLDEDGFADDEATVGSVYDAGESLLAFCNAGSVLAENQVTLEPVSASDNG